MIFFFAFLVFNRIHIFCPDPTNKKRIPDKLHRIAFFLSLKGRTGYKVYFFSHVDSREELVKFGFILSIKPSFFALVAQFSIRGQLACNVFITQ